MDLKSLAREHIENVLRYASITLDGGRILFFTGSQVIAVAQSILSGKVDVGGEDATAPTATAPTATAPESLFAISASINQDAVDALKEQVAKVLEAETLSDEDAEIIEKASNVEYRPFCSSEQDASLTLAERAHRKALWPKY